MHLCREDPVPSDEEDLDLDEDLNDDDGDDDGFEELAPEDFLLPADAN